MQRFQHALDVLFGTAIEPQDFVIYIVHEFLRASFAHFRHTVVQNAEPLENILLLKWW